MELSLEDAGPPCEPRKKLKPQIRWTDPIYAIVISLYPKYSANQISVILRERYNIRVSPAAIGFALWKKHVKKHPPRKPPVTQPYR